MRVCATPPPPLMLLIPSSLLFAFGLSLCALPASLGSPAFSHHVSGAVLKTGKSSAIKLKRPSGEAEDTSDSGEGVERREKESKMGENWTGYSGKFMGL